MESMAAILARIEEMAPILEQLYQMNAARRKST